MSTATIEPGSKVQATVTAEYIGKSYNGRHILTTDKGVEVKVPEDTFVTVLEPPLPPQPPSGSLVKADWSNLIYRRDGRLGWYLVQDEHAGKGRTYITWADLNKTFGRGALYKLVPDPALGAQDLGKSPLTVDVSDFGEDSGKVKFSRNSYGELTMSVAGGSARYLPDSTARKLAKALIKATGGE